MNRVFLIGRPTRDPELNYTQSGIAVARFTLAVNRDFKNADGEREADFINITAWRKLGEVCAQYLKKGRQCAVEGRLQIGSYEDKDGIRRKTADVIADRVEFLGNRNDAPSGEAPQGESQSEYQPIDEDEEVPF